MRTKSDRIRQAVSFEVLGLSLVTPLGAWLFGLPLLDIGLISLASSLVATVWNYVYNLGFDHALKRLRGHTGKTMPLRVLHATLFEAGLLAMLLPVFAWWLQLGLLEALTMEVTFATFYVVYAFVFTWAYDRIFPDSSARPSAA